MDAILIINAGSSSVKFQVFQTQGKGGLERLVKGQFDGIGSRPRLRAHGPNDSLLVDQSYPLGEVPDIATAMRTAGGWLKDTQDIEPIAVGHRVVHGGPDYDRPIQVDAKVVADLARFIPLAPLHQPNNLAPIRSLMERFPQLPQVACFDTAFHRGHGDTADHFAIPAQLHAEGVRRYGFHGLSYEYVAWRLRQVAPEVANGRVIVAHLGSGASMCAILNGRSIESTMGFTALDGLPMGTRPGQLDPGVVLYLLTQKGMNPQEAQHFLYNKCGLKGLSGVSNDVRALLESPSPGAALALNYFVHRVSLCAGMLAAALGGLDAFVFTAGIGERSAEMRSRIASKLTWLGAKLDQPANAAGKPQIASDTSRVALLIVPTDEELMIARHTLAVLSTKGVQDAAYARSA